MPAAFAIELIPVPLGVPAEEVLVGGATVVVGAVVVGADVVGGAEAVP